VEKTPPGRNDSLEGVWHQAVNTSWAWKFGLYFWFFYNLAWIASRLVMVEYFSYHGIRGPVEVLEMGLVLAILTLLFILPFARWLDRNKVVAMLRFDDAGIALQLKSGLVLEAGWNIVRSVKFFRWGKLTALSLKGTIVPFRGNLPPKVSAALVAKAGRMRQGPSEPTGPTEITLEDEVDRRLSANARM